MAVVISSCIKIITSCSVNVFTEDVAQSFQGNLSFSPIQLVKQLLGELF